VLAPPAPLPALPAAALPALPPEPGWIAPADEPVGWLFEPQPRLTLAAYHSPKTATMPNRSFAISMRPICIAFVPFVKSSGLGRTGVPKRKVYHVLPGAFRHGAIQTLRIPT
jgi:hypothetical protein